MSHLFNKENCMHDFNPQLNNDSNSSGIKSLKNEESRVEEEKDHEIKKNILIVPIETLISSFEKIKTHFPAARIKKIMQSDEEIGKISQATPIILGRILEIFITNLVEASIIEARSQGVKRINASHVRSAIEKTDQFDFLLESIDKYPPLKN